MWGHEDTVLLEVSADHLWLDKYTIELSTDHQLSETSPKAHGRWPAVVNQPPAEVRHLRSSGLLPVFARCLLPGPHPPLPRRCAVFCCPAQHRCSIVSSAQGVVLARLPSDCRQVSTCSESAPCHFGLLEVLGLLLPHVCSANTCPNCSSGCCFCVTNVANSSARSLTIALSVRRCLAVWPAALKPDSYLQAQNTLGLTDRLTGCLLSYNPRNNSE